jgi:lysophospholipase L1-like esterase
MGGLSRHGALCQPLTPARPRYFGLGNVALFGDSRTEGWWLDTNYYPDGCYLQNVGSGGKGINNFFHKVISTPTLQHAWWQLGINDMSPVPDTDALFVTYKGIIDAHQAEYPTCRMHVESVIPKGWAVGGGFHDCNAWVAALNAHIFTLDPAHYDVVNVLPTLTITDPGIDPNPFLRAEFTTDYTHFTQACYAAWSYARGWRLTSVP